MEKHDWSKGYPTKHYSVLSIGGIKQTPSVIPVVFSMVLGVGMATAYTLRLFFFNPDVTWNSKKDWFPQMRYQNKHYKFIQHEPFDIKNYKHPRPDFEGYADA